MRIIEQTRPSVTTVRYGPDIDVKRRAGMGRGNTVVRDHQRADTRREVVVWLDLYDMSIRLCGSFHVGALRDYDYNAHDLQTVHLSALGNACAVAHKYDTTPAALWATIRSVMGAPSGSTPYALRDPAACI